MSDSLIKRLARSIGLLGRRDAPVAKAYAPATSMQSSRMYAAARPSRHTLGFGVSGNTSADAELSSSLTSLRSRSRQMIRDNPYAKRAKQLVVTNVVGSGIGIQAQVKSTRDTLSDRVNDDIESVWLDWCDAEKCHTGGALSFQDFERAAIGQVFEAGEVFIRKHHRSFGDSRIPIALELIEAERVSGEFESTSAFVPDSGNTVRMGIEVDKFGRPVAYYIRTRHHGDIRFHNAHDDKFERVLAAEIFHLRIVDRWPQTRGEPWLHTVLTKLDAMNEYSGAEVQAAKLSALHFGSIESEANPDGPGGLATSGSGTGVGDQSESPMYEIEPGMINALSPGDKLTWHSPNRPNTAIDPFLRYMLREVSAGASGPRYAALSGDYSQATYSSERAAMLDERDCYRALQQWWIRSFRTPLHRAWLQQAVFAGALKSVPAAQYGSDQQKFEAVVFKCRGWSWVDPTKEVEAFKEAIKGGMTTLTDVIASTAGGQDIEDVVATRRRELDLLSRLDIEVDTTVEPKAEEVVQQAVPEKDSQDDAKRMSVSVSVAPSVSVSPHIQIPERSITVEGARIDVPAPVVHMRSPSVVVEAPVIHVDPPNVIFEPQINVAAPEVRIEPSAITVEAPVINVSTPDVRIEPAKVDIHLPEQPAPVVNIEPARIDIPAPVVNVAAPEVNIQQAPVTVEAPNVTVINESQDTEQLIETDDRGNLSRVITRRVGERLASSAK